MGDNFLKIEELLRQRADFNARLNLLPYKGSVEVKTNGEKKYLYTITDKKTNIQRKIKCFTPIEKRMIQTTSFRASNCRSKIQKGNLFYRTDSINFIKYSISELALNIPLFTVGNVLFKNVFWTRI